MMVLLFISVVDCFSDSFKGIEFLSPIWMGKIDLQQVRVDTGYYILKVFPQVLIVTTPKALSASLLPIFPRTSPNSIK